MEELSYLDHHRSEEVAEVVLSCQEGVVEEVVLNWEEVGEVAEWSFSLEEGAEGVESGSQFVL